MCDVFFLGTALNIPSHISDKKPGTFIEMDGKAIDARRGRDGCVVVYNDGDPNSTLDRAEPVCRCRSAIVSRLNECLVVADFESIKMTCSCCCSPVFKKLNAPKIDAISRAPDCSGRKGKGASGCPCPALGALGTKIGGLRPKCPSQRCNQIQIIWGTTFVHLPPAQLSQLPRLLHLGSWSPVTVLNQQNHSNTAPRAVLSRNHDHSHATRERCVPKEPRWFRLYHLSDREEVVEERFPVQCHLCW